MVRHNRIASFVVGTVLIGSIFSGIAFAASPAKVISLTGEVRFKNLPSEDWQPVSLESQIQEGAHIFVGPDSECQLAFGDEFKSVTRIKADSHIVLRAMESEPKVEVVSGELFALVRNLKRGTSFQVSTPSAVATVRGTAFSFGAEGIGSEVNSTLQVFEHTVGLSPMGQPDKELPVNEGKGAVMGPDGSIQKEFELSPELFQQGKEFVEKAAEMMAVAPPDAQPEDPQSKDEKKEEDRKDDDRKGIDPPEPPDTDPSGEMGDKSTDGLNRNDARRDREFDRFSADKMDSAMDGVLMDMANDSEMSKHSAFDPFTARHMAEQLSDLTFKSDGEGGPSGNGPMSHEPFADAMREAFKESDFFKSQPPDVQGRMLEGMGGMVMPPPAPDGSFPPPEGGMMGPADGPNGPDPTMFNSFMDPASGGMMMPGMMEGPYIDPNDLATYVNDPSLYPPPEKMSIINFMDAIRNDYLQNHTAPSYFSTQHNISNFSFIKDDIPYTGTIVYDPNSVHTHPDGSFLHLNDVFITDSASNVIVDPANPPEVKIS